MAQALYQPSRRLKQRQVLRNYIFRQCWASPMRLEAALVQFKIDYISSHTTIKDRGLDYTWHYESYLLRGRTAACGTNI